MAEPWFNWGGIKIGPLLLTDQDRADYANQQAQQGPSMADYMAARQAAANQQAYQQMYVQPTDQMAGAPQRDMSQTGPQWAADNAMVPAQAAADQAKPYQYPASTADWTWWDSLHNIVDPNGADIYDKARAQERQDNIAAGKKRLAAQGPRQKDDDIRTYPQYVPDAPVAAPQQAQVPVPTDRPNDPIQESQRQKALIDAIYPKTPPQNVGGQALDAELDKSKDRTNYLAQLAFFSGIAQGAGGQWEGVGRGLASAGQAYSSGFDRYQKALQAKAARDQSALNAGYADDRGRADAAVKLYSANQAQQAKLASDQIRASRYATKDTNSAIDNFFKAALSANKGNEFEPGHADKINELLKNWQISRERGEIVNSNQDVSDK